MAVGYETVSAATGRDALGLIADGVEVDLVLADLAMPEMTGAELAKAIHAKRPDLPVVIVTGYGGREVLRDFGEGKILQKPYAENELLEKIASALRQPPLDLRRRRAEKQRVLTLPPRPRRSFRAAMKASASNAPCRRSKRRDRRLR